MTVDITRPEWSDELAEALLKSFGRMQEDILLIIAERLEQLTELSPEELTKLAESAAAAEYLNDDMRRIKRAIRDQDRKYAPQIAQIYDKTEDATYKLAERYFSYRSIQISTVKNRSRTRELIAAMQKQKVSELLNLSHTYCYDYDGKVQPIGKTYRKIVNQAVNAMASGGQSYQKVLRKAMHQLSESGIKTLYWDKESGRRVARRADSHIRMNIAEGVRRLNQELQEINGKIFNADGVEVSLHHLCAPDHQPIQGRQFDLDDWERINGGLKRPIGTLNCGHHISYIIRAAARPAYTEEERQAAIDSSNEEVEYNGKKMTRYEASQRMRAKERKIRAMRSEENALKAAGDTSGAAAVKRDIRRRTAEYKKFCSDVGLEERMDKTYDFGFISKKRVDNSGESGIIKTIGEAHDYLKSVFGSVEKNVSRLDEQLVIDNTEQLRKLNKKFGVLTNKNTGYVSGSRIKATAETYSSLMEHKYNLTLSSKYYKSTDYLLKTEKYRQEIKFSMPVSNEYLSVATITHEYGHMLQNELIRNRITPALFDQYNLLLSTGNRNRAMHLLYQEEKEQAKNIYNEIIEIAKERNPDIKISEHISKYGKSNDYEAFAEMFMNSQCGEPNELGKAMNIFLERSGYV